MYVYKLNVHGACVCMHAYLNTGTSVSHTWMHGDLDVRSWMDIHIDCNMHVAVSNINIRCNTTALRAPAHASFVGLFCQ